MNPSRTHHEPRISLDLACDWDALGAEVCRRAAIMAAVDAFLAARREHEEEGPACIRLFGEVPE